MSQKKIPCSVSLLTLNVADSLPACLDALKDFDEIIICDGNSSDRTCEIALAYGAKVIKQYDTDEPNTRCDKDKAAMRQRAMDVSTHAWRFFMDADDTLSPETVEEIRTIIAQEEPPHFIWRMPTRVFASGREIKHEATYPSYQTRLVHASVGARFKGEVHDHLVWDEKRFPAGTMRNHYNFHWPAERIRHYWRYLGAYAERELLLMRFKSFGDFLYWGLYRRARTILGYLIWRLPSMYLRYGFKDSMPLAIELTIVRYHSALLFGSIGKYLQGTAWFVILVETMKGKDLNRILGNLAIRENEAYGRVLDIGGGVHPSYWRFLKRNRWHRRIAVDLPEAKPDIAVNLEKDTLPFADGYCDTAFMFNVLEHLNNRERVLTEVRRVLRKGGTLVGVVPFLVKVHPDPHDFVRFTDEGLRNLLGVSGFSEIIITPVGRGPIVASYSQSEFLLPRVLKLLVLPFVLCIDRILLMFRPGWRNAFPLSYAFSAR